ncbi:hypothetical protein A3A39_04850 [Candidatus Kaiserbacteria bacterium RIFCSPLOWO2_01_FULL_54_13]|uniref:Uncharacterized protein n=1 Tax=Candidatus Kaiserbacteria bacterium RIFCSPLOWO2_01_FULL_54_13 TaxID=1798512 RepID=A0A1F6F0W5_9BACT|nr:MAG: hypothetical protein A3A39_04850 [Candidatus Kaiserbacteria bacterium RIFCSPLOWO2_01_FULL_54_13]
MIGIFDSGSGGLTVLRALRDRLTSPDVLYFGDIKNAPYGSKSHDELSQLTIDAISFLRQRGVRSIISACNSVSASLAVSLFDTLEIAPAHLIEMVGPTVALFKNSKERLLLTATPATVKSSLYRQGFKMIGKDVVEIPIPDLAGSIESGAKESVLEEKITAAFAGVRLQDFDVLILACTHYPLILSVFQRIFGSLIILDPAHVVSERAEREWWPREAGDGKTHFVISRDSECFRDFVKRLFPKTDYTIEVLQ